MIISTRGEIQPLPGNVPLASLVAVSTDQAKAAWISSPGGDLHFQYYTSDGPSDFRVDAAVLGNDVNWSMDWVNGSVVIGRSGYLLAVSPGGMYRFADPRLPRRWYRVRGGAGRLLLHSPEAPEVVLLAPSGPVDAAGGDRESFPEVLKTYVLEAGSFLEGNGDERAAEAFYAWALPLIPRQPFHTAVGNRLGRSGTGSHRTPEPIAGAILRNRRIFARKASLVPPGWPVP